MPPSSQFGKYWLIAVPEGNDAKGSVAALNKESMKAGYSTNFPFEIPDLRTGTLDQLMSVSETLEKLDFQTMVVAARTYKGAQELHLRQSPNAEMIEIPLQIRNGNGQDQIPASQFVERFRWNQARYPTEQKSLARVAGEIEKEVMQIDEKAKNYLAKYSEMKNTLENLEKDQKGSLAIQPIAKYFKPDTLVESPSLANLILAVKNVNIKNFIATYATIDEGKLVKKGGDEKAIRSLSSAIVPNSYKELATDKEFTLCSIVVMKKFVDVVSGLMQRERHIVRPFRFEKGAVKKRQRKMEMLEREVEKMFRKAMKSCYTIYSQAFLMWIHVKAMRCYAEGILRFGLKSVDGDQKMSRRKFISVLLKPASASKEKKLRKALGNLYKDLAEEEMMGEDEAGGGEFYPYVYSEVDTSVVEGSLA